MDSTSFTPKQVQPNRTAYQGSSDRSRASTPMVFVPTQPPALLTGYLPPAPPITSEELLSLFLIENSQASE